MARGRKVSITTLDAKIEQQKETLEKVKLKYEIEMTALAELLKLRNKMRKEEIIKSDRSYAEIMAFIRGEGEE